MSTVAMPLTPLTLNINLQIVVINKLICEQLCRFQQKSGNISLNPAIKVRCVENIQSDLKFR